GHDQGFRPRVPPASISFPTSRRTSAGLSPQPTPLENGASAGWLLALTHFHAGPVICHLTVFRCRPPLGASIVNRKSTIFGRQADTRCLHRPQKQDRLEPRSEHSHPLPQI